MLGARVLASSLRMFHIITNVHTLLQFHRALSQALVINTHLAPCTIAPCYPTSASPLMVRNHEGHSNIVQLECLQEYLSPRCCTCYMMSFDAIPVLDLSRSQHAATKPAFLADLRRALLEVGFLYISNTDINQTLVEDVISNGKAFFELPDEAKLAIQMKNAPSFLGLPSRCLNPNYVC